MMRSVAGFKIAAVCCCFLALAASVPVLTLLSVVLLRKQER